MWRGFHAHSAPVHPEMKAGWCQCVEAFQVGIWFQDEVAHREKEKGSEAAEFLNPRKEEKKGGR
jgi:hypothetical protein